ncbi:MAG: ArgE/DapE family deacylase [Ignavibacteriales bacterium]
MVNREAPRVDRGKILEWLKEMVSTESVNPSLVPGGGGEAAMARFVADVCAGMGLDVRIDEPSAGRPNVIAVLRGARPSRERNLLLNGHLDTVALGGMKDALVPRESGGRLYGRGSLDMKGGLAAILGALEALSRSNLRLEGDVVLAATSDEEYASIGAQHVAGEIDAGGAVIAEATGMGLCLAHKGFAWLKVETYGKAAHGSLPAAGVDAIAKMGKFLAELDEYSRTELGTRTHHLLGNPSVHASTITGGTELSTYPDRCTLMIERRTIPGETADGVLGEMKGILDRLSRSDRSFVAECEVTLYRPPYEVGGDSAIAVAVSDAFTSVMGKPPHVVGVAAWLDSGIFGPRGIPCVIMGPSGQGQHGDEEFVNLDSVYDLAQTLAGTALRFCGAHK